MVFDKLFRTLVTLEEAKKTLFEHYEAKPIGIENIRISEAYGRTAAQDIKAPIDVPPFDRSTVDGYAVRAEDTFGASELKPITLKLVDSVRAGEWPKTIIRAKEAVRLSTGAPIPEGGNAVIMLEHTALREMEVAAYGSVTPSQNILPRGLDVQKNQTIVKAGLVIGLREIGMLSAVGLGEVEVYRRPRVAVLSTGREIVAPGLRLMSGEVYDINMSTLSTSIFRCGAVPVPIGILKDEPNELKRAVLRACEETDVAVSSGATSAGPEDILPKVLNEVGRPGVIVHGISMKPGKPTAIAVLNGKPFFALPGHPTSALITFHLLVKPVLAQMIGLKTEIGERVKAKAFTKILKEREALSFVAVSLDRDELGEFVAKPIKRESGALTTFIEADGFVEIPSMKQLIEKGEEVTVHKIL